MSRSVPHRPTTSGLISTSPGPGLGAPRSSSTASPGPRTTSAGPRSPLMTGPAPHGREDGLARRRRVGQLTLAERGVEADAARAVHPVDEDRVPAIADRHPRGQLGLPGQVLYQRPAQVTERELPADDVAQPDQSGA